VGLQWGDEGKGKVVDMLTPRHAAVVRYNGGANAGHTVVVGGERYALHLVPSGVLHSGTLAVVGNGVVVDPEKLLEELKGLAARGVDVSKVMVSSRAHVVLPYHKLEDEFRERALHGPAGAPSGEIGTTKRGIGPAYADKANRATAVRVGDLLDPGVLRTRLERACRAKRATFEGWSIDSGAMDPAALDPDALAARFGAIGEELRPRVVDTTYLLNEMVARGDALLFEGGNATLLDVDHGTYPYVTSSNCTALGIGPGTGVPPQRIGRIVGVMKAYSTRVGRGPMPTEQDNADGERIRERGREFGTTTGRPRRCGWLDLVAVKYAVMVNGTTEITMTLLDVLAGFKDLPVCVGYRRADGKDTDRFLPDGDALAGAEPIYQRLPGFEGDLGSCRSERELPAAARAYVEFVEGFVGVPVRYVGVGPGREQVIERA
jgi:adenylosuccinate synthase